MMRNRLALFGLVALAASASAQVQVGTSPAAKPVMPQICATCHQPQAENVRGLFENVAFKSQSIQLKIDAHTEILRFDPPTLKLIDAGVVKPADTLRDIEKGREARIQFADKDGIKTATLISFKGPIEIAADKLVGFAEIERLVALGPVNGNYTLIDSRPLPRVQEGTIPTAINLPYPAFDKFVDRLPADKPRLTIFFCQGITCMMSPNSLKRAEAMGYSNVRVYREGYPEWLEKNIGVIAASHLNEAWIAKQMPHVLIDARPLSTMREGYIAGAISVPPSTLRNALATLPDPKLKAPVIVYDVDGSSAARQVAWVIKQAGQKNVTMIAGGMQAWTLAGLPVTTGTPATRIAYAPKPRPGSLPADEFVRIARATPDDVMILDVRNTAEGKRGTIKGAKLLPEEEIASRLAEVPKDKHIITHCATGVRAEMAYHRLKDAGYNVAFLNADVDITKDGAFKVTPH
jgi:rhodanese-related sulfurtransferase